ncbi:MAG: signal peptidase II [Spirulina sp.]
MRLRNHLFWIAAVLGLVIDQLTKYWVTQTFELTTPPDAMAIWPGVFYFTYVTNTGAAFSLFSNNGEWLKWLSMAVSAGLIALGWGVVLPNRWEQVGYGFILAGALGNGIDRVLAGEVVDFLDFRLIRFPIFNMADVCINIGIICLLIAALRHPAKHPENS